MKLRDLFRRKKRGHEHKFEFVARKPARSGWLIQERCACGQEHVIPLDIGHKKKGSRSRTPQSDAQKEERRARRSLFKGIYPASEFGMERETEQAFRGAVRRQNAKNNKAAERQP